MSASSIESVFEEKRVIESPPSKDFTPHIKNMAEYESLYRESIEDPSIPRVTLFESILDEMQHDLEGDQLTLLHVHLGLDPGRCGIVDRFTEDFAGGNMWNRELGSQSSRLGSLACPWRSKKHESHFWPLLPPVSAPVRMKPS